jgi:hypothetical protein
VSALEILAAVILSVAGGVGLFAMLFGICVQLADPMLEAWDGVRNWRRGR